MTAKRMDAVKQADGRWAVPSGRDTVWVETWEKFRAVGGMVGFNEDQTEVTLTLPPGVKFSVGFARDDNHPAR
jgi:hypothetical protein